jgi:hypothetical protein
MEWVRVMTVEDLELVLEFVLPRLRDRLYGFLKSNSGAYKEP